MFRLISAIVYAYVRSFVFYLYAALTALSFTGFVAYAWAPGGLDGGASRPQVCA
jgi:hypothetical protein